MKYNYRPEIDGLRAIAVISVILYHAKIVIDGNQLFSGGFIGVDIFFVISGYLITSIILRELITTGNFSFKYFYERRIRRILPALLSVILAASIFAWIILMPSGLIDFSKSALYSLGFSSNFYFHYSGQQYEAESGLLRPLLHTWSLSVEEQYYVLFPIVLLFIFKYFKKYLLHFFIFGFIVSLILADWGSRNHEMFNFYVLPTRGWELLAGSILAYLEISKRKKKDVSKLNLILPVIGIFLIFYSIVFFDLNTMRHPSFYTLPPIIGVCFIIWFSKKDELITQILSSKIFVGIGLISYSLYLWHYPIFAFDRLINFSGESLVIKLLFVLLITLISIMSYYLIEKPFRNKNYKFKKLFNILVIITFIILTINLFIVYKNGFKERYSNIYIKNNFFRDELSKQGWRFIKNSNFKTFKSSDKIKVLLIGDSHSRDFFNVFIQNKDLFKNYEFLRYGNHIKDALRFDKNLKESKIIEFQNSEVFKQSDVLLISDYFNDNQGDEIFEKLDEFLKVFKDQKKIILTSNTNIYRDKLSHSKYYNLSLFDYFLIKNSKNKEFLDKNLTSDEIFKLNNYFYKNRNEDKINRINKKLIAIAERNNIILLFKQDFQCEINKEICFGITDDGKKIHYDYGHYTLDGAKFFGKKIHQLNWLKID